MIMAQFIQNNVRMNILYGDISLLIFDMATLTEWRNTPIPWGILAKEIQHPISGQYIWTCRK